MSVDYLRFIPTDPKYVPPLEGDRRVKQLLASFALKSTGITLDRYDTIQFVDAGSNWERIHCSDCGAVLGDQVWGTLVDQASLTQFTNLFATMPCCGTVLSLNDLDYEWSVGFARFVLGVRDPDADVSQEQLRLLESVVGCHLRKIWAHY